MKTKMCFLLLSLMLCSTFVFAAEAQQHSAKWWNSSPDSFKTGVVTGFLVASARGADIVVFSCIASKNGGKLPATVPSHEVFEECSTMNPLYVKFQFGSFRVGQVRDGIDNFYKDFQNQEVDFEAAIRYVCDQLLGKSDKELQTELRLFRGQQ
jgi:hypothetical protein